MRTKIIKKIQNILKKEGFDEFQIEEIIFGLLDNLDVSWYFDKNLKKSLMFNIRMGLFRGIDVSWYANPIFNKDVGLSYEIYDGLTSGIDVSIYANGLFTNSQAEYIKNGLLLGLDVSLYANPKLPEKATRIIFRLLYMNINIVEIFEKNNKDLFSLDNNILLDILGVIDNLANLEDDIPFSTFKNIISDIVSLDFNDPNFRDKMTGIILDYTAPYGVNIDI